MSSTNIALLDIERESTDRSGRMRFVRSAQDVVTRRGRREGHRYEWGLEGRVSGVQWPPAGLIVAGRIPDTGVAAPVLAELRT